MTPDWLLNCWAPASFYTRPKRTAFVHKHALRTLCVRKDTQTRQFENPTWFRNTILLQTLPANDTSGLGPHTCMVLRLVFALPRDCRLVRFVFALHANISRDQQQHRWANERFGGPNRMRTPIRVIHAPMHLQQLLPNPIQINVVAPDVAQFINGVSLAGSVANGSPFQWPNGLHLYGSTRRNFGEKQCLN